MLGVATSAHCTHLIHPLTSNASHATWSHRIFSTVWRVHLLLAAAKARPSSKCLLILGSESLTIAALGRWRWTAGEATRSLWHSTRQHRRLSMALPGRCSCCNSRPSHMLCVGSSSEYGLKVRSRVGNAGLFSRRTSSRVKLLAILEGLSSLLVQALLLAEHVYD